MLISAGLLLSRYSGFLPQRTRVPSIAPIPRSHHPPSRIGNGQRAIEPAVKVHGRITTARRGERGDERGRQRYVRAGARAGASVARQASASVRRRASLVQRCRSRARSAMKGKVKGMRSKNMDKLIAAVQVRECLWDKSYRGHRNRFKLERYWNEVAAEVGTTSLNCRKRWKNLKDQCRKEMKKNPNESEWPHFNKLKFIHNQFLTEDEEGDEDTTDEVFNSLDESIKTPKLGYTMRKKLLMNKRRTIDVDLNKLIELVKSRDIIWNRQLKGHHNWYKLDESWKEIALELGVTRDEARLKWKYIRDQARKEVRKQDSEWEYLPKLQFLTNQFNDYDGNEVQGDDSYIHDQDFDADQSTSYYLGPTETSQHSSTSNPVVDISNPDPPESVKDDDFDEFDTKPIIMETDFYDDDDEAQKNADNPNEPCDNNKDEDVGFFSSLLPHVKKLGPAKKLMLRMKIQELVYNTVYSEPMPC